MPEPQQLRIWAMSATYTTAHGNDGSVTYWGRPGIEPETSCFLVGFYFSISVHATPEIFFFFLLSLLNLSSTLLPAFFFFFKSFTSISSLFIVQILLPVNQIFSLFWISFKFRRWHFFLHSSPYRNTWTLTPIQILPILQDNLGNSTFN